MPSREPRWSIAAAYGHSARHGDLLLVTPPQELVAIDRRTHGSRGGAPVLRRPSWPVSSRSWSRRDASPRSGPSSLSPVAQLTANMSSSLSRRSTTHGERDHGIMISTLRRPWQWLWLVTGCGRFAFDPTGVDDAVGDGAVCATPAGHDEDGDSVDDACDVCPHLVDPTQLDGDVDGVGDACDPYPTSATSRIAWFDPFVTRRSEWRFGGVPPVYTGDAIDLDLRQNGFTMAFSTPSADDQYVVGLAFDNAVTTGRVQITLGVSATNQSPAYYCELLYDDVAAFQHLSYVYTLDGTTYDSYGSSPADPLTAGELTLTTHHTPSGVTCSTTWPASPPQVMGPLPALPVTPDLVYIYAAGAILHIRYLLWIHTN